MDGNPWTVVEFQFVKPGKGAAFTRTVFKNLLNGKTKEMNIRSGEKLEPANVDQREMQFLYKEAGDLVFMDQTNYEQVSVSADMVGKAADLMKDNLPCTVLFFNERAIDVHAPDVRVPRGHGLRARRQGRHQRQRAEARDGRDRRRGHGAAVHPRRRHDQDRYAHARVRRARRRSECPRPRPRGRRRGRDRPRRAGRCARRNAAELARGRSGRR